MTNFTVSGLVNIETTLKVDSFPIQYSPGRYPFFGINSTIAGVGYNITRALTTLGSSARFLGMTGTDAAGELVRDTIEREGISTEHLLPQLRQTAQSIILYESTGRRMFFTDLKDVQEQRYPEKIAEELLTGCDIAVLCNVNYSRPMLSTAKQLGKKIATDVHTVSRLDDAYNREFMDVADILFMSDELIPEPPEEWIRRVGETCGNEVVVIGLGSRGAILHLPSDGSVRHVEAASSRPAVNTIGAGDALFSAFLHFYGRGEEPVTALEYAVVFAGHKVGANGAAEGFLGEGELLELAAKIREVQGR